MCVGGVGGCGLPPTGADHFILLPFSAFSPVLYFCVFLVCTNLMLTSHAVSLVSPPVGVLCPSGITPFPLSLSSGWILLVRLSCALRPRPQGFFGVVFLGWCATGLPHTYALFKWWTIRRPTSETEYACRGVALLFEKLVDVGAWRADERRRSGWRMDFWVAVLSLSLSLFSSFAHVELLFFSPTFPSFLTSFSLFINFSLRRCIFAAQYSWWTTWYPLSHSGGCVQIVIVQDRLEHGFLGCCSLSLYPSRPFVFGFPRMLMLSCSSFP